MKVKELIEILSRYNPEMDVKLSGIVYAGIDKYDWSCEVVEEDLEKSDISTHDNYIEFYFCEKYKPFGE